MKNKLEFCATENDKRLDKSIANHFNDISRSRAKNLIEEQMVKVNDELKKPKYDLKQGDNVVINIPEPKTLDLEPENIPLDIVYEDNDVLVVNKPQGMVVHPSPGHPDHTLVNALLFHTPLSNINGTFRPGIVHRIDKDTSGLLMIAKNNDAHKSLSEQLKAKSNIREYVALVHGNIKEDKGKIDAPIGRSKKDRKKQAIVDDGKHAVTHFKVLERLGEYTLVSCVLETGRTHQIRVHMKYIGHPLVGDPLYGPRKTIKGNGQFLHAAKLGFKHPKTSKLMVFDAPLPKVFKQTINNLRNSIK
ncbi:RluA family pseudouridine synthase [Apilactobacillus timberlakei]|uniref:Pseudouridine synthase n=1 Tax=Apilactobacillus timberlakei TaxID=2008380 RepID=A0ABY2YUG2_9LACO|nr:RluA family pseudouridine synthase [Apilactobacillus timberlakei]TPR13939.1 RluA family pseudouridine synthase [Apilactobacillus timberlakei]TPR15254.1 RluA family pseudouridine synthase [Apilactobacillus timberlakei]TPR16785.1 RluA family pseudouridine synthase [Apilactobacillus timberlakei]TPR17145.1 RluA family pseudouridine synthase [Apilactobacillus timberlakei]TPR20157.1 RluA family pseudouridine synthase [Apilactobacillus timberlakei]